MLNLQIFPAARPTSNIVAIDEVPTLGDTHTPGSTRTTALQPASVATGPPLSATGDQSMSASLQRPAPESTGASSTSSPATPGRAQLCMAHKTNSPPSMMKLAKKQYRPSPVSQSPKTVIKCHAKPKSQLPSRLPSCPTNPRFQAFSWGPFTIYHGGERAPYRVRDTRKGMNTRLFQTWNNVINYMDGS